MRRRWAKYFGQVLNVADVREANINVVGNWRMQMLGDLNERAISFYYYYLKKSRQCKAERE